VTTADIPPGARPRAQPYATSIALVLAACGLVVYAWRDRGTVSETERTMRQNNVFPAWRREDVTRIEIEHGREKVVLVRAKDDWRMTSPREENVDAALVDRFVGTLEFATVVRKVGAESVPGFDAPRARGTIVMGAVTYRLELGPDAPTPAGAAYFRMQGERPIVVTRELASDLMKGADAFRTRTLVPYLSLDLAKLEVRGRANSFTVERKDARTFVLSDLGLRASRERLDRVWRAFGEMRAEVFVSEADAAKAMETPAVTVVMTPKDGRPPGELVVGGACPGHAEDVVVVRRAPLPVTAACAPNGVLGGLEQTARALVDERLFSLHDDEIEAARLEASPTGAILDLARKGGGFRERAPEGRDLSPEESESAAALVARLAKAEGEVLGRDAGGTSAAQPGRGPHQGWMLRSGLQGRVTVTHADDGDEEVVEVGLEGGEGSVFVRRVADGAVLKVGSGSAPALAPHLVSLRPRALFPEPLAGKPVVAVDVRCDGVEQHAFRDVGAPWSLSIGGAPLRPDAATIVGVVDELSRARAESWVTDADTGDFGFADGGSAPSARAGQHQAAPCDVRLTIAEEKGTRVVGVAFGAMTDGGSYARLAWDRAVFLAPLSLRAKVTPWLVDRHALAVDPALVTGIDVTKGGRSRRLDPRAKDDAGMWLAEDLTSLATETAHVGPARPGEMGAPIDVTLRVSLDGGRPGDVRFTIGAETEKDGKKVRFVRLEGMNATLIAPSAGLVRLLAAAEL
jgi:hypothetical protein